MLIIRTNSDSSVPMSYSLSGPHDSKFAELTHLPLDKMVTLSQPILSDAFLFLHILWKLFSRVRHPQAFETASGNSSNYLIISHVCCKCIYVNCWFSERHQWLPHIQLRHPLGNIPSVGRMFLEPVSRKKLSVWLTRASLMKWRPNTTVVHLVGVRFCFFVIVLVLFLISKIMMPPCKMPCWHVQFRRMTKK